MEKRTMILICLCISLALLFTIDCFYRESENPYDEVNLTPYDKFELKNSHIHVCVYDFEHPQYGEYYKVFFVSNQRSGIFRVFKEEGIEYETPVIIDEGDYYKIVIGRKGLNDLVYIIS